MHPSLFCRLRRFVSCYTVLTMGVKLTWKPVVGYEGIYSVSNIGSIRRDKTKRRIEHDIDYHGYHNVHLCYQGKRQKYKVHRLVLEAFVGPCPEGYQTRHLDGNPDNNHLENLCWGTAEDNSKDKVVHQRERSQRNAYRLTPNRTVAHCIDRTAYIDSVNEALKVLEERDNPLQLYTVEEAADILSTTIGNLYGLAWRGRISTIKIGTALRFSQDSFREYIEAEAGR